MRALTIQDIDESLLARLRERALSHGRTAESEAKEILSQALQPRVETTWSAVNAFRERLASSGRQFDDSTELLREDRAR